MLSARLTHSYAMGVKLIHIKNYECEAHSHLSYYCYAKVRGEAHSHLSYYCDVHSQLCYECEAHSHLSYYCYVMGVKLIRILNYECECV